MRFELNYSKTKLSLFALTVLIIGEICFYTSEKMYIYWLCTGTAIIVAFLCNINKFTRVIRTDSFILWLTIVYAMYIFNGLFRYNTGEFNLDILVYRYVEVIAAYYLISELLNEKLDVIIKAFRIAGVVSLIYLIIAERSNIILGGMRIGNSLSGNTNTVGYEFGIISLIIMWAYCRNKKVSDLILFLLFSVFMLITGSKKTLIVFLADFLILFIYERKKIRGWLKVVFLLVLGTYVVFNVPYFYDIIGFRIDAMLSTFIYGSNTNIYSYSTDIRDEMIKAAFKLSFKHPILGGGWNYFQSMTNYGYSYSHCNYTELLCSFGIVGMILYYSRYLKHILFVIRNRIWVNNKEKDLLIIIGVLTIMSLILEWGAVTFSAQIVWYLPLVICAASVDNIVYGVEKEE